jgi:hypothetical protein
LPPGPCRPVAAFGAFLSIGPGIGPERHVWLSFRLRCEKAHIARFSALHYCWTGRSAILLRRNRRVFAAR